MIILFNKAWKRGSFDSKRAHLILKKNKNNFSRKTLSFQSQLWDRATSKTLIFKQFSRCPSTFYRSNSPEAFLGKGVLKICGKSTGEHLCRSATSVKLRRIFVTEKKVVSSAYAVSKNWSLKIIIVYFCQLCVAYFLYIISTRMN